MQNTGKFIASVQVNGRARDAKGNIIDRDTNGLPTMWLDIIAGKIPNRQTLAGSVVRRMGVPIDYNGVIAPGESEGHPDSRRLIYGKYLLQGVHDVYGPQYVFNMIRDMSMDSVKDIEEACEYLGEPQVFNVGRPELPADYQRRTAQHIGRNRTDERFHPTASDSQGESRPVHQAIDQIGNVHSDTLLNPEIQLHGSAANLRNPENKRPTIVSGDAGPQGSEGTEGTEGTEGGIVG